MSATTTITAIPFGSARDAIKHAKTDGRGKAILLNGPKVVAQEDADRLAAAGVEFAYLVDHKMPDGSRRIMTIPVN